MSSLPPEPPVGSEQPAAPPPAAPPPAAPPPAASPLDPQWSAPPPAAPMPEDAPPLAAGQWSAPTPSQPTPGSRGGFNPRSVKPMDWGILVAGVLALIFSTFDYYTATAKAEGNSASDSISAWHGFFGWFATLLALAAAILLAVHIFAPSVRMTIPVRLTVLGAFALSTLCMIIAGFVTPGAKSSGALSAELGVKVSIDYGRGAGYFLSLIVILAGTVLAYLRMRETGHRLPWEKNRA